MSELPDEQLHFSSGGGFTGEYREHILLRNGQVFSRRRVISEVPMREYTSLDGKVADDLFDTFVEQGFGSLELDSPGNLTYEINYVSGVDTSTVRWGGPGVKPPENLRTYWRRFSDLMEGSEPLPVDK